ncbi:helix-turn-helix transcriptional regulator [Jeotgalicoccus halotolerans]|nr:response regulator transcription factor [Jeotgalicoccus halotolerans]
MKYHIGEELFILSSQPHYSILLAFYAKSLWPASDFPLKCSFHTVDDSYPEYYPDRWDHPSIKAVRESLQTIKKSKVQDFSCPDMPKGIEIALMYATDIFRTVTPLQQEVMQYYLTGITQKEIAKLTKRSVSTISKHVHASRVKQLTEIIDYVITHYELE